MASPTDRQILDQIRPGGSPTDEPRWQKRKSALTREAILEAGVDCLVSSGYAGLSINAVARRAGVSRGAIHHHYANRMELVGALVDHILYRRMKYFLKEYPDLQAQEKSDSLGHATELYWHIVQQNEFMAYLELAMAIRTNPELERIMVPAIRNFDTIWTDEMAKSFPQWGENMHVMTLASDFVQAAHLGLLFNTAIIGKERQKAVRKIIIQMVDILYRESID